MLVFQCIFWGIGMTYVLAWVVDFEPRAAWSPLLFAIRMQAATAVVAHANLLFGDPGVVIRSRGNCLPVPPVVAERLRAGDSLEGLENVRDDSDGASYCVRCCVWRRAPPPPAERASEQWQQWLWRHHPAVARNCACAGGRAAHHCSLCQRCVVDHDHHCGVLGRCIAGHNMQWFVLLVVSGWLAMFTVTCAVAVAVVQRYGESGALYLGYAFAAWMAFAVCVTRPVQIYCRYLSRALLNYLRRHAVDGVTDLPIAHARLPVDDEDLKDLPQAVVIVPAVRL